MKKSFILFIFTLTCLPFSGCAMLEIQFFSDHSEPLTEFVLEGEAREKILVIPVAGLITNQPDEGLLGVKPSMVQEVVSQLNRARKDEDVKAIVLQINSLGGTVTASDIIYHEIEKLKAEKKVTIVAAFMDSAASGGYYIAMPADRILAHPTSITGSIGVILIRPDLTGLMSKIGVQVHVDKSGDNKDMGAFFRKSTSEEEKLLQRLVDDLGHRFIDLLKKHRGLPEETLTLAASGRLFSAGEAEKIGLVDQIGYIQDAVSEARKLSEAPENARVIVYRRKEYPEDNYYNPNTMLFSGRRLNLLNAGLEDAVFFLAPGFYYLWTP